MDKGGFMGLTPVWVEKLQVEKLRVERTERKTG
jgi:hypothetical protein